MSRERLKHIGNRKTSMEYTKQRAIVQQWSLILSYVRPRWESIKFRHDEKNGQWLCTERDTQVGWKVTYDLMKNNAYELQILLVTYMVINVKIHLENTPSENQENSMLFKIYILLFVYSYTY